MRHSGWVEDDLLEISDGPVDPEKWNGVVKGSRTGTIFHTAEWIDILESSLGLRVTRLVANEEGEPVGVLPIALNRRPGQWFSTRNLPLAATSPPISIENPYGGPLSLPGMEDAVYSLVRHVLRRSLATRIVFSPDPEKPVSAYPALNEFLDQQHKTTYMVNLDGGEDSLWEKCKGNMRTHVRKARKLGVRFTSSNRMGDLEDFMDLIRRTYTRGGFSPLPDGFYREVFSRFSADGRAMLFFAEVDGTRAAGEISLIEGKRIYSWSGGSDENYWKYRINNLLSWGVLDWGRSAGLSLVDLCGAGTPSIARYKESLGGRSHTYPYIDASNGFYRRIGGALGAIRARFGAGNGGIDVK